MACRRFNIVLPPLIFNLFAEASQSISADFNQSSHIFMDKIWTFQGPIVKIFSCPTYQIQSLLKHNFGRLTKHTRKHNAVTHWHALELHYVDSYRDLTSRHLTSRGRLSTQDYRNIFSDWKMWPWNSDFSRSSMNVGPCLKPGSSVSAGRESTFGWRCPFLLAVRSSQSSVCVSWCFQMLSGWLMNLTDPTPERRTKGVHQVKSTQFNHVSQRSLFQQ